MKIKIKDHLLFLSIYALITAGLFYSCNEVSDSLAPYTGSPDVSSINIEQNTYLPKVTWLGGYITVLGINQGSRAALDSTLVWLIYQPGNAIQYPVKFGALPSGASDLTTRYQGKKLDSLSEDKSYTFWVMKEDAWNNISSLSDMNIVIDSSKNAQVSEQRNDTVIISSHYAAIENINIDKWVNIKNITGFGTLATIKIQTTNSNSPIIKWSIVDPDAPDSSIAALGIVVGQEYSSTNVVWEVYSFKG